MKPSSPQTQKLRLLFWESTIRCNLSCAHCRRVESDEAAGSDLTAPEAKYLIDQLAGIGRAQEFMPILVFSGGEPLCRKDIFELIEYSVRQGLKCALATNGTLIDEAIAGKIKAAGVERVSISLDGATSDVHNKLRKLEGSFEAAIRGIRYLRQSGVPFQVNMTVTRYNAHQLGDIFALAESLGAVAVHLFMLVPVGCGEEFAEEDMLSADEYEQLLEQIAAKEYAGCLEVKVTCGPHYARVVREHKPAPMPSERRARTEAVFSSSDSAGHPGHQHQSISKGCLAGLGVLFVGHNGQVFPCGYLPIDCGNILKTPLADIWQNSAELARMRDTNQLKGKCGICGYRVVCGGCRARAFAATGDYMEAEPMCRYIPPAPKP